MKSVIQSKLMESILELSLIDNKFYNCAWVINYTSDKTYDTVLSQSTHIDIAGGLSSYLILEVRGR